jgi:chemosensory pili system protein ChpA (sensor histidine kinase/response regulator)
MSTGNKKNVHNKKLHGNKFQVKNVKTFTGLEWLVGEIENSLQSAFNELEAFTQNNSDETKIRFCLGHLHQISGSFKILQCEGCILLVEEMEALTQGILDKKISNINEACEILVQAIIKLPIYLRQILSSREDHPEALIILLNDLRAAQGLALVSEGVLFSPDLSSFESAPELAANVNPTATADLIKRLRQVYQLSLIKLIKGEEKNKNCANLIKVLQRMQELSKDSWRENLWRIARQILGLVASREINFSIALKKLFRALDSQLKIQAKEATSDESSGADMGLLKNLLYYLTTTEANSEELKAIWTDYSLAEAFPSGEVNPEGGRLMPQYDPQVVRALVSAIQGELANVRSALERFSLEGGLSADDVRDSLPVLLSMADSLALVGQGKLRDAISKIEQKLRQIFTADGSGINDADVIGTVQSLTEVELALNAWAARPDKFSGSVDLDSQQNQFEFNSATQSLLAESRTGIERIKEAVVEFINSQWDLQLLHQVPAMFQELQGALNIIGLTRAAAVIDGCLKYVQEVLINQGRTVEWQALDTFADAITIVEYYLEQFNGDTAEQQEDVLAAAEESILALLENRPAATTLEADKELYAEPEEILEELAELQENQDSDDSVASISLVDSLEPIDSLEQTESLEPVNSPELVKSSERIDSPEPVDSQEDHAFDDEIIEIFIEEAEEVLEGLNSILHEWRDQPQSQDLLPIIRRSFHTLKGSGRMVGAEDIGELAWSIEDMLNRVLDGRISCSTPLVELTEQCIQRMPLLIAAFAEKLPTPTPEISQQIIASAERLAKGEAPESLPDSTEHAETVTDIEVPEIGLEEQGPQQEDIEIETAADITEEPETEEPEPEILEVLDVLEETTRILETAEPDSQDIAEEISEEEEHEAILLEIFVNEAQGHLKTIDDFVAATRSMAPLYKAPPLSLQRALHTLKGTAEMADFSELSQLVAPLEEFIKELYHHHICLDEDIVHLVEDAAAIFRNTLTKMTGGDAGPQEGLPMFRARLAELREKAVGHLLNRGDAEDSGKDFSAVKKLMAEGLLSLQNYPQLFAHLQQQTAPPRVVFHELLSDLNEIGSKLKDAEIEPILQLAEIMAEVYQLLQGIGQAPSQQVVEVMQTNHETLLNLFDMLAADQDLNPLQETQKNDLLALKDQLSEQLEEKQKLDDEQLERERVAAEKLKQEQLREQKLKEEKLREEQLKQEQLKEEQLKQEQFRKDQELAEATRQAEKLEQEKQARLAKELEDQKSEKSKVEEQEPEVQEPEPSLPEIDSFLEAVEPLIEQEKDQQSTAGRSSNLIDADLDQEIVGVFVEEADDIVSSIEESVLAWQSNPAQVELADRLKRDLHTLKGGARMAGFNSLGERAHAIESLIDETKKHNKKFFKAIVSEQEKLVSAYDIVRQIARGGDIKALRQKMEELENQLAEQPAVEATEANETESEAPAAKPLVKADQQAASEPAEKSFSVKGEIKEVVRIGAEVLDTLVNLSGENIIFRGRIEEQVSEFNQFLDEMDATVVRLQEQVRRLGTETEAQIDYRREQIEASGEAESFDPLEMDRYSHLQQLTGSLMESASDLHDLKETLNERLIGTETLLLHQSRINTDLQEGLMKTRMVPFARIVPRLRRIVRQVGLELGKKVELRMDSIHGEMDRSVLDRMVAPLEHMIRNAVDHGIESEQQRKEAGKPETGSIAITTYRQGGDIVIHLADDGRGLDVERIRQIALEKELISEDAALSEHEIAQFIFHPGFSTSDAVSQISGRGVGMDVVNSEVRQCGGSVDIETSAGRGTQFTIVLPFTLSVNRALMINVTGDHYALSLNSIDGVHFMSSSAVEAAMKDGGVISYAGSQYELCYLGTLLNPDITRRADNLDADAALVLFHSDNRRFAVQVDEIVGTKEIVVKTMGPQFSGVPGLGGATILSDGQVVVIIDLNELARVAFADLPRVGQGGKALDSDSPIGLNMSIDLSPCILVVDDSVTVRKVTSRILRRQGYRVLTAKDGIEALKSMQEEIPAVILLDIEMPRMDGFEVATRVRASQDLKDIPIVMITSRTGDKHRQRAMELGVDYYMGKPYQEEQLLETLNQLLTVES